MLGESTTIKCVIFDLDGTLLDTSPGILESVRYAIEKLGYPPLPTHTLLTFIGPPLRDSFVRCCHCGTEEAGALTESYRECYRAGALLNAKPYDGIFETCRSLREMGVKTAVATSKPQVFADRILRHFELARFFDFIHGADLDGKLKKSDIIKLCVKDSGALPAECVMVGDTEHDARGAEEAGVKFLAVSYGFGTLETMLQYPNIGVAKTAAEIVQIICNYGGNYEKAE